MKDLGRVSSTVDPNLPPRVEMSEAGDLRGLIP